MDCNLTWTIFIPNTAIIFNLIPFSSSSSSSFTSFFCSPSSLSSFLLLLRVLSSINSLLIFLLVQHPITHLFHLPQFFFILIFLLPFLFLSSSSSPFYSIFRHLPYPLIPSSPSTPYLSPPPPPFTLPRPFHCSGYSFLVFALNFVRSELSFPSSCFTFFIFFLFCIPLYLMLYFLSSSFILQSLETRFSLSSDFPFDV